MRREYPATPDEAFEQALEGAYFAQDLFAAAKQGRIGGFPYDPRSTVQTFWDLGRNDLNTIWLHQHVNGFDRFIGYYENSGEFIGINPPGPPRPCAIRRPRYAQTPKNRTTGITHERRSRRKVL